jgi:hypothetical protein
MPNEETAKLAPELVNLVSNALVLADRADLPLVAIHLDEALIALKRITG